MDASTPKDLLDLLQSGGNAATILIVWIAFKIKAAIDDYLKGVNSTLEAMRTTIKANEETQKLIAAKLIVIEERTDEIQTTLSRIVPKRLTHG